MAYITVAQATAQISVEGNLGKWKDASAEEQAAAINRATRRIESLIFVDDDPERTVDRFTDGKYTDHAGAAIADQDMPSSLMAATAALSNWYVTNTRLELHASRDEQALEQALSPHMQDLPISIQAALWPFLAPESKGQGYLDYTVQARREQSADAPRTTRRGGALVYV